MEVVMMSIRDLCSCTFSFTWNLLPCLAVQQSVNLQEHTAELCECTGRDKLNLWRMQSLEAMQVHYLKCDFCFRLATSISKIPPSGHLLCLCHQKVSFLKHSTLRLAIQAGALLLALILLLILFEVTFVTRISSLVLSVFCCWSPASFDCRHWIQAILIAVSLLQSPFAPLCCTFFTLVPLLAPVFYPLSLAMLAGGEHLFTVLRVTMKSCFAFTSACKPGASLHGTWQSLHHRIRNEAMGERAKETQGGYQGKQMTRHWVFLLKVHSLYSISTHLLRDWTRWVLSLCSFLVISVDLLRVYGTTSAVVLAERLTFHSGSCEQARFCSCTS